MMKQIQLKHNQDAKSFVAAYLFYTFHKQSASNINDSLVLLFDGLIAFRKWRPNI